MSFELENGILHITGYTLDNKNTKIRYLRRPQSSIRYSEQILTQCTAFSGSYEDLLNEQ